MNFELLNFLSNFINYLIFIYIFMNTINTSCFNSSEMTIAIFGLILSVFIYTVDILNKRGKR